MYKFYVILAIWTSRREKKRQEYFSLAPSGHFHNDIDLMDAQFDIRASKGGDKEFASVDVKGDAAGCPYQLTWRGKEGWCLTSEVEEGSSYFLLRARSGNHRIGFHY
jgi:hypothetical protein